jgi:hypothetical protein
MNALRTAGRSASLALLLAATVALFGCSKATAEDCAKMVDRMTELELEGQDAAVADMTKKMMEETKLEIVAECEGKLGKSQVQCVIDAKTKADIDKCK